MGIVLIYFMENFERNLYFFHIRIFFTLSVLYIQIILHINLRTIYIFHIEILHKI